MLAARAGKSGERNRGGVISWDASYKAPGQPMADVRYTLAESLPGLEPDARVPRPETPDTSPSPASSARNSACYGFTSGYVPTPKSPPISTPPSRSGHHTTFPAAVDNNNNNNTNLDLSLSLNINLDDDSIASPLGYPPSPPRSRRTSSTASHRSHPELHAARLQRPTTVPASTPVRREPIREPQANHPKRRSLSFHASADSSPERLASSLTKMDDRWIIVQQKTFTKWSVVDAPCRPSSSRLRQCFSLPHLDHEDLTTGLTLAGMLGSTRRSNRGEYKSKTWLPT